MKKQKSAVVEEKGECAPLWIISFADMISLLMAFFVMLLTMSTAQSGKLCNEGEGIFEKTLYGFRRTIAGLGLPEIFGGIPGFGAGPGDNLNFKGPKTYYPISEANEPDAVRTIDADEEKFRRIFNQLQSSTRTLRSPLESKRPDFVITPVTFEQAGFTLQQSHKQFLSLFAADVAQSADLRQRSIYIVGFAPQEATASEQWIVSAKRAQAVADYLKEKLPQGNIDIYCWGAGSGGDWEFVKGITARKAHILIAVLSDTE